MGTGRAGLQGKLHYLLPKDVLEGDRLDLQHHILRYALEGDFVAPIGPEVHRILDVGCGTGIWCEELALDFPDAIARRMGRTHGDRVHAQSRRTRHSVDSPARAFVGCEGNGKVVAFDLHHPPRAL